MSKAVLAVLGGLAAALIVLAGLYAERGRRIAELEGQNNALCGKTSFLEAEIAKRNEKALAADKRLREIEAAAETEKNKGGFDWNSPLPVDSVTMRLRAD